jgi:hypothetical protein
VLRFPGQHMLAGEQEVGVLRGGLAAVDHAGGADKAGDRDRVGGVGGQVFAGDPVHRRVEVGAGVLAQADGVPVPGGAFVVVVGDFLHGDAGRGGEDRRQTDDRRLWPERLGEVDDLDLAAAQFLDQQREDGRTCAHGALLF